MILDPIYPNYFLFPFKSCDDLNALRMISNVWRLVISMLIRVEAETCSKITFNLSAVIGFPTIIFINHVYPFTIAAGYEIPINLWL